MPYGPSRFKRFFGIQKSKLPYLFGTELEQERKTASMPFEKTSHSSIGKRLETKLAKKYPSNATIHERFGNQDITFLTDEQGIAIQLFIGKRKEDGHIRGDRFSRRIIKDASGKIIRTHWDRMGKIGG